MFKKKKKIQPTTNPAINNRIERLHESTFTLEMRVFDTYATILCQSLSRKYARQEKGRPRRRNCKNVSFE